MRSASPSGRPGRSPPAASQQQTRRPREEGQVRQIIDVPPQGPGGLGEAEVVVHPAIPQPLPQVGKAASQDQSRRRGAFSTPANHRRQGPCRERQQRPPPNGQAKGRALIPKFRQTDPAAPAGGLPAAVPRRAR